MSNTVVNTNVLALNSHRSLKNVGTMQAKASARLSSGMKINSAADDAAGLAISEKMRAQIRGLDMASKNSQDGISLIQTAEGGLQEVDNMVQRIRELAVQSASETNVTQKDSKGASLATGGKGAIGGADTVKLAAEASQLIQEINSMVGRVEFNKKNLLRYGTSVHLQVGANASQKLQVNIGSMNASKLGLTVKSDSAWTKDYSKDIPAMSTDKGGFSVKKANGSTVTVKVSTKGTVNKIKAGGSIASAELKNLDKALKFVTDERAKLGSYQNRLEYTIKSLDIASENLSAAESRIRDTDMAKEMMNVTKANVLQQAATSMLSQANQAPQNVLQLLR